MTIVHNVYLLGGAVYIEDPQKWADVFKVARGTINNGYCKNDYILQLYRASIFRMPIGLVPLFDIETGDEPTEAQKEGRQRLKEVSKEIRVNNFDVTKEAIGHTYYRQQLAQVLEAIDFNA